MSNSEVLSMAGTEKKLIQAIRRRQLQFLGHVLRKQELEDVALTGKIEGKRARGKQRLTYLYLKPYNKKLERTEKCRNGSLKEKNGINAWEWRKLLAIYNQDNIA